MSDLIAYREGVIADLNRHKANLAPLESGRVTAGSRTAGEDWRDTTAEVIEGLRETIVTYEKIVAFLDRRIAGEDATL